MAGRGGIIQTGLGLFGPYGLPGAYLIEQHDNFGGFSIVNVVLLERRRNCAE